MPAAALTLSDVASLVAVIGVLLGPLAIYLRWLHQRVAALEVELAAARASGEALAGAAARGFASVASVAQFETGVFARLFDERLEETNPDELISKLGELREGISRAWAETSVLSDDGAARQSALRQINATLGDEHSARIARLRSRPSD